MAEVKLLGLWYSPFSHRVEWALKMKGVEYDFIEEDLQKKSPLLLESNPIHKKIPVLIHNGKPICESMVIVEYIDETFDGPSILPKGPYDRAIARFWVKFFSDKGPSVGRSFFLKGEEQEKAKEEVYEMLKVLDNELKDNKKFFVGNKFGFADIAANAAALWLGVLEEASGVVVVTREKFPNFVLGEMHTLIAAKTRNIYLQEMSCLLNSKLAFKLHLLQNKFRTSFVSSIELLY